MFKLEISLSVFHDDQIVDVSVETYISVKRVCRHIAQLNQSCINNGKYKNDSPNDLFLRSLELKQYFQKVHQTGTSTYVTFYLQH